MRHVNERKRRGFTLIELMIGTTIAAIVGIVLVSSSRSLGSAFQTTSSVVTLEGKVRQALDRVTKMLETASGGSTTPAAPTPPNIPFDSLDFQQVVGFTAGAPVLGDVQRLRFEYTAADPNDGVDNDGDGLVDEGRLVWIERPGLAGERRRVIVDGVAEALAGEVPGNFIDDNGNSLIDERGFNVQRDAGRITVQLTVELEVAPRQVLQRTVRRTVLIED